MANGKAPLVLVELDIQELGLLRGERGNGLVGVHVWGRASRISGGVVQKKRGGAAWADYVIQSLKLAEAIRTPKQC